MQIKCVTAYNEYYKEDGRDDEVHHLQLSNATEVAQELRAIGS